MSKVVLLAVLFSLTGCVHVRRPDFVIPLHCMMIRIQSFTQPCQRRADGKLVCNGVVITANCVAPPLTPLRKGRQVSASRNQ